MGLGRKRVERPSRKINRGKMLTEEGTLIVSLPDGTPLPKPIDEESLKTPPSPQILNYFGKQLLQGFTMAEIARSLGYEDYEWALRFQKHPQYKAVLTNIRALRADHVHEEFTQNEIIPSLETPATEKNKALWESLKKKQEIYSKQKTEDSPTSFEDQSQQQNISITSNVNLDKVEELLKLYTPKDDKLTVPAHSEIIAEEGEKKKRRGSGSGAHT